MHRRYSASNDLAVAQDYFNLAQVLEQQRKFAEAEATIREAIDIVRPVVDPDHLTMTSYMAFLSHILIELGKWDEAETLLKTSVAGAPTSAAYRNALGNYYARRGRWAEAAQELQREASLCTDPAYVPLFPIVALLEAGQVNDCEELWRTYAKRHANTREFIVADKMAKAGLLLPLDEADLALAGRLADYASTAKEPAWLVPWTQFVKALAELRRSHLETAMDWCSQCLNNSSAIPPCRAGVYFVQAITAARLNHAADARKSIAAGKRLMAARADSELGNYWGYWPDWAIADLLRHEAEAR